MKNLKTEVEYSVKSGQINEDWIDHSKKIPIQILNSIVSDS